MLPEAIRHKPELIWARRLVWLYFGLLILEGALRKWIMPGLSAPLLIVRDPVVIMIYLLAMSRGAFPLNAFVGSSIFLALATTITTLLLGHGNFLITLYGVRVNFLHLPLIFVIPHLFDLRDIWRFGKAWLWISLPMALLIVWQFLSPSSSWLNCGASDGVEQIQGALGHVRPSGSFSFVTGTIYFLSVQLAFIVAAFFEGKFRWLRLASLVAFLFALTCSISRTAILASCLVLGFGLWVMCINPSKAIKGVAMGLIGIVLLGVVSFNTVFKSGWNAMSVRFEEAVRVKGSEDTVDNLYQRVMGDFWASFSAYKTTSAFGEGTGLGTNVAAQLLTGKSQFILAEIEWSRLLLESGYIWGTFIILLRVCLVLFIFVWAFKALGTGNTLPLLLFAAVCPLIFNGSWSQPTALGFACLIGGFSLAATRPRCQDSVLMQNAAKSIK